MERLAEAAWDLVPLAIEIGNVFSQHAVRLGDLGGELHTPASLIGCPSSSKHFLTLFTSFAMASHPSARGGSAVEGMI